MSAASESTQHAHGIFEQKLEGSKAGSSGTVTRSSAQEAEAERSPEPSIGGQLGQQRGRDSMRQNALRCFVAVDLSRLWCQCPASFQSCSQLSACTHAHAISVLLGKLSDIKSTWSSGPASHTQASLSHELWKVPRNTTAPTRPPPGLANPKPSSTWGTSPLGWTSSYSSGKHCSGNSC